MMNPRNVAGSVSERPTIRPVAKASTSAAYDLANSVAVDRQGFLSALLVVRAGAVTGAPSAQEVDVKVQESADGSGGWVDVPGAAITQITAVNTSRHLALDLSSRLRFIRAVPLVGFTGGTSPTIGLYAGMVLGGAAVEPPAQA